MKNARKLLCIITVLVILAALSSCGSGGETRSAVSNQAKSVDDVLSSAVTSTTSAPVVPPKPLKDYPVITGEKSSGDYDIDLVGMNSTMIYSEVSDMIASPDKYMGKTVRMRGTFGVYEGENRNYYACLIADATACCSQGIEFVLSGDYSYPADYPPRGTEITVTGVFDMYRESGNPFIQLIDARAWCE